MEILTGFIQFPGGTEWLIIFLVILVIFGPKSLPKIGHAIGRGMREFREASEGITRAIEEEVEAEERDQEEAEQTGEPGESEESSEHTD